MKGVSVLLVAASAGAGTLAFTRPASALGPVDIEIAARAGYGTSTRRNDATNPMGVGLGARAGISFLSVYAGASAMYYFGGSDTPLGMPKDTQTSWMYGVEGGYSVTVLVLTLRPLVGVGEYTLHSSTTGSAHSVYIEPGATALITLGSWLVGADANVLLAPALDQWKASFTVNGQVGLKF
jgi:hypothetical protein